MLLRFAVRAQPEKQPSHANGTDDEKGPSPPEMQNNPRDKQRSDNRAHIGAGIEYPRCKRPLLLWKPLRNRLYAGWKRAGFSEAQRGSRKNKFRQRMTKSMRHRGHAPEDHGHGVADTRSKTVNHQTHCHHPGGVGRLECENKIAIVNFIPAEVVLKCGFQHPEHLTIHVIFADTEEEKPADHPAKAAGESRSHDRGLPALDVATGTAVFLRHFLQTHGNKAPSVQSFFSTLLVYAAGQESTVNLKQCSSHKTCGVGSQKHGSAYQFIHFSKTFHRRAHQKLLPATCAIQ